MELIETTTNDSDEVIRRLRSGPQLCFLLNKDIEHSHHFNVVKQFYVFGVEHSGEERLGVLMGAYKEDMAENPDYTRKAFGRQVKEKFFEESLTEIDGILYLPFVRGTDPQIIRSTGRIYEVQDIEIDGEPRYAAVCCLYDYFRDMETEYVGRVVSQGEPVIIGS